MVRQRYAAVRQALETVEQALDGGGTTEEVMALEVKAHKLAMQAVRCYGALVACVYVAADRQNNPLAVRMAVIKAWHPTLFDEPEA